MAGIDLAIHPSWLVIAFLLTFSLADAFFPRVIPGWTAGQYWLLADGTALLFFASVLAHELSHAIVARRFGLKVGGITLFIFGGATTIEPNRASPRDEALIALAGPFSSLAIGGVLLGIGALVDVREVQALLGWLGVINVVLGAFNLVPGYPMDGGRVLRAILWRLRGDPPAGDPPGGDGRPRDRLPDGRRRHLLGTALAGHRERAVARARRLVPGHRGGGHAAAGRRRAFPAPASGFATRWTPAPPAVSPNESVADLVSERMLRGDDRSFLVRHDDGGLAGMVTLGDVRRLPRDAGRTRG